MLQTDTLSAFLDKSDSNFVLKLDDNLNVVAMRFQMHSSTYNTTYYKYGAAAIGKCRFDTPCLINEQTKITT